MTPEEEIVILKQNVKELQEQLQNAYIRIKYLTGEKETTPVDRHYDNWVADVGVVIPDGTGHGPAMEIEDGWSDETTIQIQSTSRGHNQ